MISGWNYVPPYLVVKCISVFQFESNPSQCEFDDISDRKKNSLRTDEKTFRIHFFYRMFILKWNKIDPLLLVLMS